MKPYRWEKDGYVLRSAAKVDVQAYYEHNFNPLSPEIAYLTGCKPYFSREEVTSFFLSYLKAEDRCDFLILSPDGDIIGESVINEIDPEVRCANFHICLFHPESCGKGIGSWAIRQTVSFAFEVLRLHRLELDVFSFNARAIWAYEKAGFRREGVRREAVRNGDQYVDDILMAILEAEWRTNPV